MINARHIGRRIIIAILDLAIVGMILAGAAALHFGAYRVTIFGVRISATNEWRPWLNAGILLVLRTWLAPVVPAFKRLGLAALRGLRKVGSAGLGLFQGARRAPMGEVALFDIGSGRRWSARLSELAIVTAGFASLVAAFTWPQVREMHSVADMGDPLLSIWRLAWVNHQIWRHPSALFDANIFYPERLTLTYSDPFIVPALTSAPLFWLGVQKVVIYNVVFLSGFVFSGVTTYYLARSLTGRRDAAVVAGVVFALHPYRLEHYSHLELQMTTWMPVSLWGLHRVLAKGRLRDGLITGGAFALQMLSSLYYGMYFAVYLVVMSAVLWLGRRCPGRPILMLAAGAALAGVLVGPVAFQYVASRPMMGDRDLGTVGFYSAAPADYLKPHFRSYPYREWSSGGMAERQLFPHVTPVVLALAGLVVPPVSVAQAGYAMALVATVDGSLGVNGFIFPWLRAHVPGYAGLRVPARFSILVGLSLAVLGGYGAARLLARWPRARVGLMLAMLAPMLFESLPNIPLERVWSQPPDIYDSLAHQPGAVVAELPVPSRTQLVWSDTRYEYFSTFHWYRMVNGNSGFAPPSYLELLEREVDFPNDDALAYLKARGVTHITWHGAFTNPGRDHDTVAMLGARTDVELVAVAPWEGSESRLYRFK
ncbi:MAG: glycosyltransferase family 39 protein [Vicinamibacterales bacterium]